MKMKKEKIKINLPGYESPGKNNWHACRDLFSLIWSLLPQAGADPSV